MQHLLLISFVCTLLGCGNQSRHGLFSSPSSELIETENVGFDSEEANPITKTDIYFGDAVDGSYKSVDGYLDISDRYAIGLTSFYGSLLNININGKWYQGKIRARGSLSRKFPKRSFTIDFKGEEPVFFGKKRGKVVFNASWVDPSFLRNWLVMGAIRRLGGLAPKFEFVQMRIRNRDQGSTGKSLYIATYHPSSHIKNTKKKRYKNANIMKAIDHSDWEKPLWHKFEPKGKVELRDEYFDLLKNHCQIGNIFNTSDFHLFNYVHNFFANTDTWTKNYYTFWRPDLEDGVRIYNWDADLTLGIRCLSGCKYVGYGGSDLTLWHNGKHDASKNLCFEKGVSSVNEYYTDYRIARKTILNAQFLNPLIDEQAKLIETAANEDFRIWSRKAELAKYYFYDEDGIKILGKDASSHSGQVKALKAALARRIRYLQP